MTKSILLLLLLLVSFTGNAQNSPLATSSASAGWDSDEVFMSGKPVVSLPRYGGICTQSVYTGKTKVVDGQERPIYIDGWDERTYYPIQKGGKWERKYFKSKFNLLFFISE